MHQDNNLTHARCGNRSTCSKVVQVLKERQVSIQVELLLYQIIWIFMILHRFNFQRMIGILNGVQPILISIRFMIILLKLDILGHDDPTVIRMLQDLSGIDPKTIPTDDPEVMKIFSGHRIFRCNGRTNYV